MTWTSDGSKDWFYKGLNFRSREVKENSFEDEDRCENFMWKEKGNSERTQGDVWNNKDVWDGRRFLLSSL